MPRCAVGEIVAAGDVRTTQLASLPSKRQVKFELPPLRGPLNAAPSQPSSERSQGSNFSASALTVP